MVSNSVSTKSGDGGETSLFYGGRVSKSDRRIDAAGIGDAAISALGFARAQIANDANDGSDDAFIHDQLLEIQRLMFLANAEVATDVSNRALLNRDFQTIDAEQVHELDALLARLETSVELPPNFIIPGASVASAALDVARCKVRDYERAVVAMHRAGLIANPQLVIWLNRLSDCVFIMGRYVDRELPPEIVTGTRRQR